MQDSISLDSLCVQSAHRSSHTCLHVAMSSIYKECVMAETCVETLLREMQLVNATWRCIIVQAAWMH
jgi:hypothetical protein